MIQTQINVGVDAAKGAARPLTGPIYGLRLIPQSVPAPTADGAGGFDTASDGPGEFPALLEVRDDRGMAAHVTVPDDGWITFEKPMTAVRIDGVSRYSGAAKEWWTVQYASRPQDGVMPAGRGERALVLALRKQTGVAGFARTFRTRRFKRVELTLLNKGVGDVIVTLKWMGGDRDRVTLATIDHTVPTHATIGSRIVLGADVSASNVLAAHSIAPPDLLDVAFNSQANGSELLIRGIE